ncbi:hypothetical protein [Dyadobacter frigoris]|uniref:DUF1961 family protein n=1 Tax=Dyadobacter frigoris TaxID=2576211 RepID=A0A4U6D5V6_9BACT|nr:hypothetical protein [Dyadobacter frigoris]TKT91815.1 hypothetical protein FDK13_11705 [Dyadobacter frigoris]GLU53325.1 hypothetical protein Dfri01_27860 [Dyadobacter frigoris]
MQENFLGVSQFSHLITTNPVLSKFEFGSGYMDMVRILENGQTGGYLKALQAVPFSPNPETLYIQISFSVEEINETWANAVFFYSGENFNPDNNQITPNNLLFSRFTLNFLSSGFQVHDVEMGKNSSILPLKTLVTITWVLNNSVDGQIYRKPESAQPEYKVMPGRYDLWVNDELIADDAKAYPGSLVYSITKLSNFEIRFWRGAGRVRFTNLRIRDITNILLLHNND